MSSSRRSTTSPLACLLLRRAAFPHFFSAGTRGAFVSPWNASSSSPLSIIFSNISPTPSSSSSSSSGVAISLLALPTSASSSSPPCLLPFRPLPLPLPCIIKAAESSMGALFTSPAMPEEEERIWANGCCASRRAGWSGYRQKNMSSSMSSSMRIREMYGSTTSSAAAAASDGGAAGPMNSSNAAPQDELLSSLEWHMIHKRMAKEHRRGFDTIATLVA
uniref:Uncharacterized protein n=1 Tax=Oryza rufipogon TaxID=4529 RepID=A0A0E0R3Y2_ORYRU